ncbi:tetratricopeptide repeat protein [Helicobacter pylori]
MGSFKKAIFRVLCLCCVLIGGGLMAEPNPKELFDLGVESYKAKDYIQAEKYFEKACDLNNGVGCKNLGFLYEYGEGVEKDLTKAAYFYSKACKLGSQEACEVLKEK